MSEESRFVYAVAKATNEKVLIPRRWLDHPTLGKGFKLPPSGRARQSPPEPDGETGTDIPAFQGDPSPEENHNESPATGEEE